MPQPTPSSATTSRERGELALRLGDDRLDEHGEVELDLRLADRHAAVGDRRRDEEMRAAPQRDDRAGRIGAGEALVHLPELRRAERRRDGAVRAEETRADEAGLVARVLRQRLETQCVAAEQRLLRVVREVLGERAAVPGDGGLERAPLVLRRDPGEGHARHDQDRDDERTEFDLK